MKKFLLSLAVLALGANVMDAETVTVDFGTATTLPTAEAEAAVVKVGDVDFTMAYCKKGAYKGENYLQLSGKNNQGKAYIEFKFDKKLTGFTLTTGSNASVNVKVQLSANGTAVGEAVQLNEKSKTFSFAIPEANQAAGTVYKLATANAYNAQITKMVFTLDAEFNGETPDTPEPEPAGSKFELVNSVVSGGQYNFVANNKAGVLFSKDYGYMSTSDVTIASNAFDGNEANAISFTAVEGKADTYTMKDSKGRLMGMDTEHKNTFQLNTTGGEGFEWTVTFNADKKAVITNILTGRQVMLDTSYNSFGMYKDDEIKDTFVLPELYKLAAGGSGVAEIEAAEGEAVYYNLQGVKVANPENGLYIRVQGGKSSKVLVK